MEFPAIFAYFGPEVTMPAASLLASVTGFVLMASRGAGGYVWHLVKRFWARWVRKEDAAVETPTAIPIAVKVAGTGTGSSSLLPTLDRLDARERV